jgi:hypothetical protein
MLACDNFIARTGLHLTKANWDSCAWTGGVSRSAPCSATLESVDGQTDAARRRRL